MERENMKGVGAMFLATAAVKFLGFSVGGVVYCLLMFGIAFTLHMMGDQEKL